MTYAIYTETGETPVESIRCVDIVPGDYLTAGSTTYRVDHTSHYVAWIATECTITESGYPDRVGVWQSVTVQHAPSMLKAWRRVES